MSGSRKGSPWKRLLRAYRCADPMDARARLRGWYGHSLGQELLAAEREQLDDVLPNLFGYHLLQVGVPARVDLVSESRISHCMVLEDLPVEAQTPGNHCLYGEAAALPFASDSLDVLLLPHTLEFEPNPHQVLREADRALVPEGHVVILCFNPWSLWGFWRLLVGWRGHAPWCGRFFTPSRLKDWLALLGFDTVLTRGYFFRPPIEHPGLMQRLLLLERAGQRWWSFLGGGFMLVARKRVTTLTPIRPRWRPARTQLLPGRISQAGLRRNKT